MFFCEQTTPSIKPFEKGGTFHFFLFLKEKSSKKEADQHAVGLPVGMEAIYRKAQWSLRGSPR